MLDTASGDLDASGLSRPTVSDILLTRGAARNIQDARRHADARGTQRGWVQAYWRYAAASGEAGQRRRWALMGSRLEPGAELVELLPRPGVRGIHRQDLAESLIRLAPPVRPRRR